MVISDILRAQALGNVLDTLSFLVSTLFAFSIVTTCKTMIYRHLGRLGVGNGWWASFIAWETLVSY